VYKQIVFTLYIQKMHNVISLQRQWGSGVGSFRKFIFATVLTARLDYAGFKRRFSHFLTRSFSTTLCAMSKAVAEQLPDTQGHFGPYGGRYVPETLMHPLQELEAEYFRAQHDPEFQRELQYYLKEFCGRPTPLYFAERLTKELGGASQLAIRLAQPSRRQLTKRLSCKSATRARAGVILTAK
jgi:hypothetical protein